MPSAVGPCGGIPHSCVAAQGEHPVQALDVVRSVDAVAGLRPRGHEQADRCKPVLHVDAACAGPADVMLEATPLGKLTVRVLLDHQ